MAAVTSSDSPNANKKSRRRSPRANYTPLNVTVPDDTLDNSVSVAVSSSLPSSDALAVVFWCLGLLNNSAYVILLASAKSISEGGTALVFVANILPSLVIKLTAPYWFDYVDYHTRILLATTCMSLSFLILIVANAKLEWELLGVALTSTQAGLGEATLLALAGICKAHAGDTSQRYIGSYSSGTGVAGVFGFLWKFVWNDWIGLSLKQTLGLALGLAFLYGTVYRIYLWDINVEAMEQLQHQPQSEPELSAVEHQQEQQQEQQLVTFQKGIVAPQQDPDDDEEDDNSQSSTRRTPKVHEMTVGQRFRFVASLYPYTIPLFTVYMAEYTLQAGTWTAIGFPVDDEQARDRFYEYSNWMYQAGVFVSRSSGSLGTAPLWLLWIMPGLQVLNVVFFALVGLYQDTTTSSVWMQEHWLLPVCFYVGLLGGAVYVHGYKRICADYQIHLDQRELALAATSVAESVGILVADVLGLFLQSCLYQVHHLPGAIVSCPVS